MRAAAYETGTVLRFTCVVNEKKQRRTVPHGTRQSFFIITNTSHMIFAGKRPEYCAG